jgi:large subunit ribosomal protein L10
LGRKRPGSTKQFGPLQKPRRETRQGFSQGQCGTGRIDPPSRTGRAQRTKEVNMPTEAKRETIAGLAEEARASTAMIVSEYRGLKVSELGAIRRSLRQQNVTYHVVKNRLMKRAATEAGNDAINSLLTGPTAIAFIKGDEGASAKAVLDAFRPYRLIKVTGGVVGEQMVSAEGVTRLAQLPTRNVLLSQVAGAIAAPMSTMAGLFDAPLRDIAGLVQALADQKGA